MSSAGSLPDTRAPLGHPSPAQGRSRPRMPVVLMGRCCLLTDGGPMDIVFPPADDIGTVNSVANHPEWTLSAPEKLFRDREVPARSGLEGKLRRRPRQPPRAAAGIRKAN